MPSERSGAPDGLRRYNLSRVLGEVHRRGPTSRSDLGARTNLNRSTVATLAGELHARGLVEERPPPADGPRPPGRPSPLVQIHRNGVTVLVCDIAVDSLRCAIVGLGGHVYAVKHARRTRDRVSPDETIQDLARLAGAVRACVPDTRLRAVGVGVVGVVSQPDGVVRIAPNLGWRDVALGELLATRLDLDLPVHVGNEANLGAIAEHARGAGSDVDDFIYLSSEIGIGAGVIASGVPLSGSHGYAGEAGHMPANPTGLFCGCGSRGCWETEIGERALLRAAGLPIDGGAGALTRLIRQAEAGSLPVLHALEEVGHWLGLGLATLVNLFDPRRIVIGGFYADAFQFVAPAARASIARRCRMGPGDALELVPTLLGDRAVLLGAAELALRDVIADPTTVAAFDDAAARHSLPQPL